MSTKEEFKIWFSQVMPSSFSKWLGSRFDTIFDEIEASYLNSFGQNIFDVYEFDLDNAIEDIIRNINRMNNVADKSYSEYNQLSNEMPNAVIGKWYIAYLKKYQAEEVVGFRFENPDSFNSTERRYSRNRARISYIRDLEKSLLAQSEDLFPEYTVFGASGEGFKYSIGGYGIELLLEHKSSAALLAVKFKAGISDLKTYGEMSMLLQLLEEQFSEREIKGVVFSREVDDALKIAKRRDKNIQFISYKIEIRVNDQIHL